MSLNSKMFFTAGAVAVALSLGGASSAFAQTAKPAKSAAVKPSKRLAAFAGRWTMNADKTHMGRLGPNGANIKRDPTFTWMFTPTSYGLRMDVYTKYPLPAPSRTMMVNDDRKLHPCVGDNPCLTTGGNPKEQFYRYYSIDDHMLGRVFYDRGEVVEYSTYAVSKDGKTFTCVSWSPETPEFQNIQVFDKEG